MPPQGEADLPKVGEAQSSESQVSTFVENAWDSLKYSAVQVPADGIAQLSDKVLGTNYLPEVQMFEPPKPAEFGSTAWYGQTIGGTVGGALPFIAMYRMMGPGGASQLELSGSYALGRSALPYIGKAAATGAVYSGVFQPVHDPEHFWEGRLKNTAIGGLTGATLTATTIGLKSSGVKFLGNDIVAGASSGVPAGVVYANAHSLLEGNGFASAKDNLQTAATFSLGGAFMGGANILHEHFKPTSGIRGVRTVEDMKELADSTRASDWKARRAAALAEWDKLSPTSAKATDDGSGNVLTSMDLLKSTASGGADHYAAVHRALSTSKLPADVKEMIARGNHDLITGLEALQGQEPIVVIYGSARLGENTFAYQRTRYLAGRLAQEGFTVMTGGGEKGIMEAANRGAFEAGGKSIGVNIELPFESRPNPWLTTSINHRDFFTRKEVLRTVKAAVIEEGGLGTSDEAFNGLTLMQTGKTEKIPTFFEGVRFYKPLVKGFIEGSMLKTKVISPEDVNLYRLTDNPDSIVNQLVKLRNQEAGGIVVSYDKPKAGVGQQTR